MWYKDYIHSQWRIIHAACRARHGLDTGQRIERSKRAGIAGTRAGCGELGARRVERSVWPGTEEGLTAIGPAIELLKG